MTELTSQACHILFSASLNKTGLRTKNVSAQSHAPGRFAKLNDLEGRTRLNRTNLKLGGPDVLHQTPPSPDESVSHLAEGEKPRMANQVGAGED